MTRPILIGLAAVALAFAASAAAAEATGPFDPSCAGLGYILVIDVGYQGAFDPVTGEGLAAIPVLMESKLPCPGPPAKLSFLTNLEATSCGSSVSLTIEATDEDRRPVVDGTVITASTTLGRVQTSVLTRGGTATVSLNMPTRTAGVADVYISTGEASAMRSFSVSC